MKKWSAAFKKKGSGRLWWLTCKAKNITEATEKLIERTEPLSYNLYAGPLKG